MIYIPSSSVFCPNFVAWAHPNFNVCHQDWIEYAYSRLGYIIENKAMLGLLKVGYSTKFLFFIPRNSLVQDLAHPYCVVFDAWWKGHEVWKELLTPYWRRIERVRNDSWSQVEAIKAI